MAEAATIRNRDESFGLGWALVLSGVLHLLLILLSIWVPLKLSSADELAVPEEATIEFSFMQPTETEADEPAGDLPPAPTPPQPAAVPDFVPPGEPEPDLTPDQVVIPPEVATPPLPEQLEQPEPEAEPVEEQAPPERPPEEEAQEPDQPGEEAIVDLPQDPAAGMRSGVDTAPRTAEERPRLDVDRALRDFGRIAAQRSVRSPQAESSGGGTPSNVFVPDFSALPSTGFGMGNLHFESADFDWSDYGRQIYMAIWRAWHNRLHVTTNEFDKWSHQERNWYLNHSAAVRFVIERNGGVTGVVIEAKSGCLPLDQSAVDALEEVLLPPLPSAFPRDREVVHARFITRGDVRTMKQILNHYKHLGLF